MIILAILALAVLANGIHFENKAPSPMDMNMFRPMCEQNGVDYAGVELAAGNLVQCMNTDFGVKMLETELKDAYKLNSYDAFNKVFKKYCPKTPVLKACYHKLLDVVATCLGGEKQNFKTLLNNINDQIVDYVCENDGYIISKFIMERGPECFEDKGSEIMMCAESSTKLFLSKDRNTFTIAEGKRVFDDFTKCLLRSVETCPTTTPSEIVQRVTQIIHEIFSKVLKNNANVVSQRGVLLPATLLAIMARLCNIRQHF